MLRAFNKMVYFELCNLDTVGNQKNFIDYRILSK